MQNTQLKIEKAEWNTENEKQYRQLIQDGNKLGVNRGVRPSGKSNIIASGVFGLIFQGPQTLSHSQYRKLPKTYQQDAISSFCVRSCAPKAKLNN